MASPLLWTVLPYLGLCVGGGGGILRLVHDGYNIVFTTLMVILGVLDPKRELNKLHYESRKINCSTNLSLFIPNVI